MLDVIERRGTSGACRVLNVFTPDGELSLIVFSNAQGVFASQKSGTNAVSDDLNNLFGLPAGVGMPYEVLAVVQQHETDAVPSEGKPAP